MVFLVCLRASESERLNISLTLYMAMHIFASCTTIVCFPFAHLTALKLWKWWQEMHLSMYSRTAISKAHVWCTETLHLIHKHFIMSESTHAFLSMYIMHVIYLWSLSYRSQKSCKMSVEMMEDRRVRMIFSLLCNELCAQLFFFFFSYF